MRLAPLALLLTIACHTTGGGGDSLATSRQAIIVLTDSAAATSGTLQRFERDATGVWRPVGGRVAVVVGRKGLAPVGQKKEGDGRSPSGVFSLGTAFGFREIDDLRIPLRVLRPTTECVDDSSSHLYNQIVDRDEVLRVDWSSSEKMATINQYRLGVFVEYNSPPIAGRGSCIFLHIWSGPSSSTAGCTAMSEQDLETLVHWLDPIADPKLIQFTRSEAPPWVP